MRTQETHCGYDGHYCATGRTFFISRYRGVNDFTVLMASAFQFQMMAT